MVVKTIDGYLCGGNQTPLYQIRERNVWSQPTVPRANDVPGGWGNCTRCPSRERKHRAAFCRSRTSARTCAISCYTRVYELFRRNAGVIAWSGRGITLRDKSACHGPAVRARPAPVVRSSFRMLLATAAHDKNQNLYIHARASAARFSDNVTTQGERFRKAPRGASGSAAS